MAEQPPHPLASTTLSANGTLSASTIATPTADKSGARVKVPPNKVVPIIFIPGIMGSNLRLTRQRQQAMRKENNIAWRPDRKGFLWDTSNAPAGYRQQLLDPATTEVDVYDPGKEPQGAGETADHRHDNVKIDCESPWLRDDPATAPRPRSAVQKARERGWGEVMFDSYGKAINWLEDALHNMLRDGQVQSHWPDVVGKAPTEWGRSSGFPGQAISSEDLRKLAKAWFPVHAMGYNWLHSNGESGKVLAQRIDALMKSYRDRKFRCDKVIVVTHSMGGLVARALVHPKYGNFADKVLGVVHGAMPTIGAPAAYKRMKAGFEGVAARVLGSDGERVTAVLAHAPGGLELLPTGAYGNGWLKITDAQGKVLKTLPAHGDPYGEIYQQVGAWWNLINPRWLRPAKPELGPKELMTVCERLAAVKAFHAELHGHFHPNTLATYCDDPERKSFGVVEWRLQGVAAADNVDALKVHKDNGQGKIVFATGPVTEAPFYNPWGGSGTDLTAKLRPPAAPGDETVPTRSAEAVGGGALRQTDYEHQGSYKDNAALHATLYAVARLALKWEGLQA